MRGFIANTDFDWFTFLSSQEGIDEVDFWQPSAHGFGAVPVGSPFFFRLKSPHNAIAGFGYFAEYSALPAWLAWEAFGVKNGAEDLAELNARIARYRSKRSPAETERAGDYEIGCVMIASPVFFPRELWVREPAEWHPNIVVGRGEDLTSGEGLRIFTECMERAEGLVGATALLGAEASAERYGAPLEVRPRLGQGIFRIAVLDAYDRACAVTGEHSLPVLDAAHIKPYSDGGAHDIANGMVLRSDVHRLFDLGYVTVTPDYRFEVSDELAEEYHNGRAYYALRGQEVHVPKVAERQPSRELLDWHGQVVFRA